MSTVLNAEYSLERLQQDANPVFPPVLVRRRVAAEGQHAEVSIFVRTAVDRDPDLQVLDGAGTALHVVDIRDGFVRGYYVPAGIVGTEHGRGYFCADLSSGAFHPAVRSSTIRASPTGVFPTARKEPSTTRLGQERIENAKGTIGWRTQVGSRVSNSVAFGLLFDHFLKDTSPHRLLGGGKP